MIHATLTALNNGFLFECTGHADFAPEGQDIVCAGVSALCIGLLLRINDMERERMLKIVQCSLSSGELILEIEYPNHANTRLLIIEAVKTVLAGLEHIERLYPEHLLLDAYM